MKKDPKTVNEKIKEKSKERTKEKISSKTTEKPKKSSTRRRKITKAQEAKKKIIFDKFRDQWTFAKLQFGDQERICFMYHTPKDGNSVSKIDQWILSGDLLSDGKYEIQDYRVEEKFDVRTRKDIIVLYLRKYELTFGKYTDKNGIKDEKELKNQLIKQKILTPEQFDDFYYHNRIPVNYNLTEIRLEFDDFN